MMQCAGIVFGRCPDRVSTCTLRRRCGTFLGWDTGMLPLATDMGTMAISLLNPTGAFCLLPHNPITGISAQDRVSHMLSFRCNKVQLS